MKHLLIIAHPDKNSFNHAILDRVKTKLISLGQEVEVRDLYDIGFNPIFGLDDLESMKTETVPADVLEEQKYIAWAERITVIAPIWWGYVPAMLKGYIDRVFTINFAIAFEKNQTRGLLTNKKIGLIHTLSISEDATYTDKAYQAYEHLMEEEVFKPCQLTMCFHKFLYSVDAAGDNARQEMLVDIDRLIERYVLDADFCPFF